MSNWPYPHIVAHRGGGKLAPENTLAAIDVGARYGHTMIEFDAKLSKDGEIFLLHDDNLERTSNGWGVAGELPWQRSAEGGRRQLVQRRIQRRTAAAAGGGGRALPPARHDGQYRNQTDHRHRAADRQSDVALAARALWEGQDRTAALLV